MVCKHWDLFLFLVTMVVWRYWSCIFSIGVCETYLELSEHAFNFYKTCPNDFYPWLIIFRWIQPLEPLDSTLAGLVGGGRGEGRGSMKSMVFGFQVSLQRAAGCVGMKGTET